MDVWQSEWAGSGKMANKFQWKATEYFIDGPVQSRDRVKLFSAAVAVAAAAAMQPTVNFYIILTSSLASSSSPGFQSVAVVVHCDFSISTI